MARSRANELVNAKKIMTPCECPRCNKSHDLKLFWVGKLPAKKFCDNCRRLADRASSV